MLGAGSILPNVRGPPAERRTHSLMDVSEDQLIEAISRLLSGGEPGVVVGIGEDAAVVEPGSC